MAKIENKFFPGKQDAYAVTTAGGLFSLSDLVQGVTDAQRVGDSAALAHLDLMYSIEVGSAGLIAAADQFNTVRVILFQWKESDGLTAPTAAIILDAATSGTTTDRIINNDDPQLFRVIYDQQHVVFNTPIWNGAAVIWYHGVGAHFALKAPIRIPLKGKITFDSGTSYGYNKIWALVCSDSAFAPNPTIDIGWQLCFTDA